MGWEMEDRRGRWRGSKTVLKDRRSDEIGLEGTARSQNFILILNE